ncbi:MAG: transcriptional regulator [Gemmatimonadaceae bacterium]|nr:transcriptional regulator [Gemmatimonadaceae bacterium]
MVAKRGTSAAVSKASERAAPSPTLTTVDGNESSPLALDRLIHERIRLAIVSTLAVHEMLTFNELKALLETTDGNLSVHARKLEDARYVACVKGYDGRIPRTEYRLTATGRQALERYLSHMEALIRRVGEKG